MTIQIVRAFGASAYDVWALRFAIAALTMALLVAPSLIKGTPPLLSLRLIVCATLLAAPYARNYDYVLLIPPLLLTWRASRTLPRPLKVRLSRALIFVAILIAGVFPYFVNREAQGSVLWLSALMGYLAALSEIRTGQSRGA